MGVQKSSHCFTNCEFMVHGSYMLGRMPENI